MKILALCGSLRQASLNKALLQACAELAPAATTVELYDALGTIPPYNDDVREQGYPDAVADLRQRIADADGLIFATPEYNRSFSGVLKNAIDWASRPPEQPLAGKPALVIGAGPGALGTALANYHLRQVLSILDVHVVPGFEILVGQAGQKFADGKLTDQPTRDALSGGMAKLVKLATAFRAA